RAEQARRAWLLPDLAETVARAERASVEVWCRRPMDVDAGFLMLGVGDVGWHPILGSADGTSSGAGDVADVAVMAPARVGAAARPGDVVGVCGCRGPAA